MTQDQAWSPKRGSGKSRLLPILAKTHAMPSAQSFLVLNLNRGRSNCALTIPFGPSPDTPAGRIPESLGDFRQ